MTTTTVPGGQSALTVAESVPRRHLGILLFGPEGEGKTTAAASAPGPILYANADRPGGLRFARRHFPKTEFLEIPVDGKAVLETLYVELKSGTWDGIETVILDSLGRLYDVVLASMAKDDKHPTLPERGDVNTFLERYILALLELPFHIVLVAHDNPVITTGNSDQGTADIELFPFTGTNTPGLAKKIMRALDVVSYCGSVSVDDDKVPDELPVTMDRHDDGSVWEYTGQLFKAGGRRCKDTTGVLGQYAPLNLTEWIEQVTSVYHPSPSTTGAADAAAAKS